ncbi:2-succinyl-5-enolpyruvyl-6-hydroxy-3-cyclohexene-1-carboxylic-acid synthase [Siccibacter colletis]|uniref:2-succinyl-5-enolpyruvyl-6-hydroxy-3- cyclohexene-1-carboxylic-acid synthase n=1 Tax=Siccibacter colletis TaxID=1505757 RepID=UPI0028BE3691|nr:2-succinyl-5-enolpyruvyl-6-hydroxy-3-cyclohexene-1-carboxylic-acid synthase [Siccibacter colletis]WNN47442.1 2-succinyl-5-enolpyruvyl-6-hydroxy-3-cyclohexene-1-carboxylic-acid synthase [Siccibacter colletis]
MSTSAFNRRWATAIVEAITRHGVRHVCIAPGSRSTPLTLAAAEHPALTPHTHFDERGLGHLALGLAKASGEPVAVIVTSGTAVANLYPAVIEAGLTGEKLILLTADRPPELIDCGANQAIRQTDIFASHPAATLSLPRPTPDIPARWLLSAIDNLLGPWSGGAVHINCPFAEPLYGVMDDTGSAWLEALGTWWKSDAPWLHTSAPQRIHTQPDWAAWSTKRGVILAGRLAANEGEQLAAWAQRLGWPLIGDTLSCTGQPLPCADLWLAHPEAQRLLAGADIVLQFGGSLTGKRLLQWQAACTPQEYWLIDSQAGRLDPAHHRGRRLVGSISDWLAAHPAPLQTPWAPALAALARSALHEVEGVTTGFGEAQIAHRLPALLPVDGQLFLGNSLVVRLVDAFTRLPAGYPVFSNRGASGIDGLISTAAGVQRGSGRPTLAVVGDLSALYDLNALALLREVSAPLVLLIINNNGGQIFSLLPTDAAVRERFYCMPQQIEFRHAAAMFGLDYHQPASFAALSTVLHQAWQRPRATVIEAVVSETGGVEALQQLLSRVSQL